LTDVLQRAEGDETGAGRARTSLEEIFGLGRSWFGGLAGVEGKKKISSGPQKKKNQICNNIFEI
jgi:hypothetical protein